MRYIKESYKGLIFVLLLFVVNAVLWLSATPLIPQTIESTSAQIVGSVTLLSFSFVFFLSTKNRFVDWLFGGLENVYATHRWLAMGALIMIFIHSQTANLIVQYYRELPINPAVGELARNLFIALIVLALLAKYMKYEHWRMIHRLMLVPYLIALYHALFIGSYDLVSLTPLGLWTMGIGLVGTGSSVYMILIYRKTAFKFKGTVKSIETPASGVTEIELETEKSYDFKDGQFTFIKIDKPPFNGVPHPFSISGSKEGHLYFSIKALGDYTKALGEYLEKGDEIKLTRPYGHMTFETFSSPQVWIAGGIGITPFLSRLRSGEPLKEKVTLYYSVRTIEEAVHLEYLRKLDAALENFTLEFSESDKDGFLSVENMNLEGKPHVFMCGPIPMAKALKRQFSYTDAHQKLTVEAFSFTGTLAEDVLNHSRKLYKKIRVRFSN